MHDPTDAVLPMNKRRAVSSCPGKRWRRPVVGFLLPDCVPPWRNWQPRSPCTRVTFRSSGSDPRRGHHLSSVSNDQEATQTQAEGPQARPTGRTVEDHDRPEDRAGQAAEETGALIRAYHRACVEGRPHVDQAFDRAGNTPVAGITTATRHRNRRDQAPRVDAGPDDRDVVSR
jgi:hypothetical protein